MQISILTATGVVTLHPLANAVAADGVEVREVEALPEGAGKLHWDGTQLVRLSPPPPPLRTRLRDFFYALPPEAFTDAAVLWLHTAIQNVLESSLPAATKPAAIAALLNASTSPIIDAHRAEALALLS